jgi:hypothetical protein
LGFLEGKGNLTISYTYINKQLDRLNQVIRQTAI